LPPSSGPEPSIRVGPFGRIGLAVGKFKTIAQLLAEAEPPPEAATEQGRLGRYLARTTCAQCHGTHLRGESTPDFVSADLRIVAAYSPEAFTELMRTGVGVGGRKLETMGPWARKTLSSLTDAEIAALYSYLHDLDR
jgi:mono/diheme cytochrome c family protein